MDKKELTNEEIVELIEYAIAKCGTTGFGFGLGGLCGWLLHAIERFYPDFVCAYWYGQQLLKPFSYLAEYDLAEESYWFPRGKVGEAQRLNVLHVMLDHYNSLVDNGEESDTHTD